RQGTLKSALTAKMFCGQAGWDVARVGSEMFGGLGYTDESPIGKLMRDMPYITTVAGGHNLLPDLVFTGYFIPVTPRT
ncbi:acyl-CoA dehydrogenase, partial [Streptomyces rubellomurinus subsp. indigoferus]